MVLRRLDGNGREKHQGDPGLTVLWSPYLSLLLTRGGGLVVSLAIDLAVEFSKTSQLADAFLPVVLTAGRSETIEETGTGAKRARASH
jgi:hypothetical protein